MRTCKKCGEEKPLSEYYLADRERGWYHGVCKDCHNAASRARRLANLEEARRKDRERYKGERAEKQRATARAYYHANIEREREQRRAYYQANPHIYEKSRAKRKAAKKAVPHEPYTRREIYDRDGGCCRICGKSLERGPGKFQIDHIVPISLGGPDTPANVQLACPTCNREKWNRLEGQIHFAA